MVPVVLSLLTSEGVHLIFTQCQNATSRWWVNYWTRCRIEPQHISCTLTLYFQNHVLLRLDFGLLWPVVKDHFGKVLPLQLGEMSRVAVWSFSSRFTDCLIHTCRQTENTGVGVVSKSATEKKRMFRQLMGWYKHNSPLKGEQKDNLCRRNAQTPTPSKHRVTEKKRKEIAGILGKKLAHCEKSQLFKWKK